MGRRKDLEKRQRICELRVTNPQLTLKEIGQMVGICASGVQRLLKSEGAPTKAVKSESEMCQKVCGLRQNDPYLTLREIGEKTGVTRERVRQILKSKRLPTKAVRIKISKPMHYCQTCGKETVYRVFCSSECRLVELVCEQCGVSFKRRIWDVVNADRRKIRTGIDAGVFCSKKCFGKVIYKLRNEKKKKIERI